MRVYEVEQVAPKRASGYVMVHYESKVDDHEY